MTGSGTSAPIDAIKHKDTRKNIPTRELRDFVAEDEASPAAMLYPRDPSLDPQLVWKGKDEQDRGDLAVPIVPIYIQEKIHPQAIIESLRDTAAAGQPEPEVGLFADFNGLPSDFEHRVDFYKWDGHWSNRMVLGDSLLVMTSLAEKEGLKGKVQTIYFDPPYGIKFGSNWQVSTRKRDVKDGKVEDATRQPEQIRAFRDTWRLGIHSYLAYLRDRLVAARELLTETGSVFVQIGDENVHLVRCVLDEVFGSDNFCAEITVKKTTSASTDLLSGVSDYILWYAKKKEGVKYRQLYNEKVVGGAGSGQYTWLEEPSGERRRARKDELANPQGLRFFRPDQLTSQRPRQGTDVSSFTLEGQTFTPGKGTFKSDAKGLEKLRQGRRLLPIGSTLTYVRFIDDFPAFPISNLWEDTVTSGFADPKTYVVQTLSTVVQRCLLMTTDPGDLVLDPTCGSGTTAYVAEQWGRRWITIDTSRVALALARTRLMAGRYPYYQLADQFPQIKPTDSDEVIRAILKQEGSLKGRPTEGGRDARPTDADIRKGFIYKRVPHITLKSIANNPDIREGMTREEIDAAIARHADTEQLFDKPYEDPRRIRVAGPFTVESLSPHRMLEADAAAPRQEAAQEDGRETGGNFEQLILENLKSAGVQNTRKGERLKFDSLEPHAGVWVHAAGGYTDSDGKARRVAVSIGPEHGTVGPDHVKEAAKEAVQGVGYDLLLVCGFAFDPHVSEEAKRYGKLTVLPTRMNPDLAMWGGKDNDLLKKTGAGNLFMVFGEPDVEIRRAGPEKGGNGKSKTGGDQLIIEIKGVDVYDPTTGQIRSSATDDIACWFIDTEYDGESFMVRHAYFTGADEPYEKLKRALRAEIDEAAWSALYSTVSRPFDIPEKGKIAVKVINHYGDEVLKVFEVGR